MEDLDTAARATTWLPIDSAPKDGTWFVAVRAGEEESYEVGCWSPYDRWGLVEVGENLFRREITERVETWRGFNNMHRMTHWAPLLAIPDAEPDKP